MNKIILIVGVFTGILMLIFNGYISYEYVEGFSNSIKEKNDKLSDIAQFNTYLSQLKDAETGQRGYVITGNKSYLEPYEQGVKYVNSLNSQAFLEKYENQLELTEEIQELKKLAHMKIEKLNSVINTYNNLGFETSQKEILNNDGKNVMDRIRLVIDRISGVKQNDIKKDDEKSIQHLKKIVSMIFVINLVYLILISICLTFFTEI
ncbi:MAG: CHASE3 domain-containing protein [Parachlamydiaceae bacterium]|nr:CHASE3 domain-containing protein [Parachlamydiaceae bacterium]